MFDWKPIPNSPCPSWPIASTSLPDAADATAGPTEIAPSATSAAPANVTAQRVPIFPTNGLAPLRVEISYPY